MNSGEDKAQNLSMAERLLIDAAEHEPRDPGRRLDRGALSQAPPLRRGRRRFHRYRESDTMVAGQDVVPTPRPRGRGGSSRRRPRSRSRRARTTGSCWSARGPWRTRSKEGVVLADLDFDHHDRVRASLPVLNHRRTEVLGL